MSRHMMTCKYVYLYMRQYFTLPEKKKNVITKQLLNKLNNLSTCPKGHEYLRSQCNDKIKIDLYNNREGIDDEKEKIESENI